MVISTTTTGQSVGLAQGNTANLSTEELIKSMEGIETPSYRALESKGTIYYLRTKVWSLTDKCCRKDNRDQQVRKIGESIRKGSEIGETFEWNQGNYLVQHHSINKWCLAINPNNVWEKWFS